jgi:hypothetical protein
MCANLCISTYKKYDSVEPYFLSSGAECSHYAHFRSGLATVEDVRTFSKELPPKSKAFAIMDAMDDEPKRDTIAANLRALQSKFGPQPIQRAA